MAMNNLCNSNPWSLLPILTIMINNRQASIIIPYVRVKRFCCFVGFAQGCHRLAALDFSTTGRPTKSMPKRVEAGCFWSRDFRKYHIDIVQLWHPLYCRETFAPLCDDNKSLRGIYTSDSSISYVKPRNISW